MFYKFQEGIIPYFDAIMERLKGFLVFEEDNPDSAVMFNQCLDTLASLARAVGPAGFAPKLAEECCTLALSLMEKHDDPGLFNWNYSGGSKTVLGNPNTIPIPNVLKFGFRTVRF